VTWFLLVPLSQQPSNIITTITAITIINIVVVVIIIIILLLVLTLGAVHQEKGSDKAFPQT
jgi:competence protein ComGC